VWETEEREGKKEKGTEGGAEEKRQRRSRCMWRGGTLKRRAEWTDRGGGRQAKR